MGIPIEKTFVVKAPAGAVWDFLTDPSRVAKCLPGAAITDRIDDQTWGGTISVKVGPVVASYRGKVRFEKLDAAAREAEISGSGQETRGKGGADMRMKSRVSEHGPGESEVSVVSDVNVVGVLAQFGRGMIQDVSDQLFQKFTEGMRRELEGAAAAAAPPPAPPSPLAPSSSDASLAGGPAAASPATAASAPSLGASAPAAAPAPPAAAAASPASAPAAPAKPFVPAAAAEEVLDVGALGAAAARRAAGRTLRRPGFWIVLLVLALLIYWFLRH